MRRVYVIIFVLLSILLHIVCGWELTDLLARYAQAQHEHALARLAESAIDVVYLTQPANAIAPDQSHKVGIENNRTSEETVATHHEAAAPASAAAHKSAPSQSPKSPAHAPAVTTSTTVMAEPRRMRPAPATAIVRQFGAGPATNLPEDFFPNYKHGEHTYINIWRYPSISYFVELKQTIMLAWNPNPTVQEHFDVLYHTGAIKTVLGIAIDDRGNLQEAFVLKSSGVAAYDAEALRAFTASAPFFAPPHELLALDGRADNVLHISAQFYMYL